MKKRILYLAPIVLSVLSISIVNSVSSDVPRGSILSTQYSAYSGVPFPNCVDIIDNETVVLHYVGSCAGNLKFSPDSENMKYYADLGYHVKSWTKYAGMNATTTLVKLDYISSYADLLKESINMPPTPPQ